MLLLVLPPSLGSAQIWLELLAKKLGLAQLVSFSKKLGLEKFAKTSLFQTKETYGLQNLPNAPSFTFKS